jgi:soluble lytic murein transglycosylase-like protein
MAVLKAVLAAVSMLIAAPVRADAVDQWQVYISEASLRYGIPEGWIRRVMRAESGGQTSRGGAPIRSQVGAMGLMQLMPRTWAEVRGDEGLGRDPDDPRDNILAGTAYLRAMYDQFGYPGLFAAYNAGPARYASYLAGRSRLPAETIAYVASIAGGNRTRQADTIAGAPVQDIALERLPKSLFFAVRMRNDGAPELPKAPAESGLFVPLRTAPDSAE